MKHLTVLLLLTTLTSFGSAPTLSNFEINSSNPNRVYFESSEPISASNYNGFAITNKTISGITINGNSLTGHYLTVSSAFSYWDNNTIRYEGGGDLKNLSNEALIDITLTYIVNSIPEPPATVNRYVTNTATGGGNGFSEATAWTMNEAFTNASAGQTVWIKAGNYGRIKLKPSGLNGTATNPIKFIGYKSTIGDITSNYWSTNSTLDPSEMPYFKGDRASDPDTYNEFIQIWSGKCSYIFIENIQIENYERGVHCINGDHFVFKNFNARDIGEPTGYSGIFGFWTNHQPAYTDVNGATMIKMNDLKNKFLGCKLQDVTGNYFGLYGNSNLIKDCEIYQSLARGYNTTVSGDYYFNTSASYNIMINNLATREDGVAHAGYAYSVRTDNTQEFYTTQGENRLAEYNLIDNNISIGVGRPLKSRNYGANYNVFKNNIVYGYGPIKDNKNGGISIFGGAKFNIYENNIIHDVSQSVEFYNNVESDRPLKVNEGNIIRNNIFYNSYNFIHTINADNSYTLTVKNNKIYNNTIWNLQELLYREYAPTNSYTYQGNEFVNNIVNGFINVSEPTGGTTFENSFSTINYNRFDVGKIPTTSTNHVTSIPQFVNVSSNDFHLQGTSPLIDLGLALTDVMYDFEKNQRPQGTGYDMGAFEYGSAPCGIYVYDTISAIIDSGYSFSFNGQTITATGTYNDTIIAASGCDTVRSLYLSHNLIVKPCKLPTGVIPVIDGTEDSFWASIQSNQLTKYVRYTTLPSATDLSASYKIAWDATSLYVLINVTDDAYSNDNPISTYWYDDGVNIEIDGLNENNTSYDANDFSLVFKRGETFILKDNLLYAGTDVSRAENNTATGYLMEIKIDWSLIGVTPSSSAFIGFDISVNDDDDGAGRDAKIIWNDETDEVYRDPSLAGLLIPNTTDCYNTTSINEGATNTLAIYPNPSNGTFTIDMNNLKSEYSFSINNALGQLVYQGILTRNKEVISLKEKGVYLLNATDKKGNTTTRKIIVK